MPFKDKQKGREYHRLWMRKKRSGLIHPRIPRILAMSWRRNPEEKERIRKLADEIFGTECYLCERKINVGLHEIHGLKHDLSFTQALAVKHPEDFVRLCYPCHKAVHWIMIHFALSWEEIKKMYV